MALVQPTEITKVQGEEYTYGAFVRLTPTGDEWDDVPIPNELHGQVRPEWVRVQYPVLYDEQLQPPAASVDARAQWEADAGGDPQWRIADDATQGDNAIRVAVYMDAVAAEITIFVEYGIRHSTPR